MVKKISSIDKHDFVSPFFALTVFGVNASEIVKTYWHVRTLPIGERIKFERHKNFKHFSTVFELNKKNFEISDLSSIFIRLDELVRNRDSLERRFPVIKSKTKRQTPEPPEPVTHPKQWPTPKVAVTALCPYVSIALFTWRTNKDDGGSEKTYVRTIRSLHLAQFSFQSSPKIYVRVARELRKRVRLMILRKNGFSTTFNGNEINKERFVSTAIIVPPVRVCVCVLREYRTLYRCYWRIINWVVGVVKNYFQKSNTPTSKVFRIHSKNFRKELFKNKYK